MSDQACPTREKRDDHGESRAGMAQHLNRKQGATDWTDHGVDSVPDRIDPRDLVREEFEKIKNAGNNDDRRMSENIERLIVGTKCDPMKMNRESGRENCEVEIDSGERGETKCNAEQV